MNDTATPTDNASAKNLAWIAYGLYALGFVIGITSIAAIILNYVKRDEVKGTIAGSHFEWQIRTFWFGLLWSVVGMVLMIVLVGWFVLMADLVWVIYRLVVGALALNDGRPIVAGRYGLSAEHAARFFGGSTGGGAGGGTQA
jgi:uncharacterized membrane protein